MLHHVCQNNIDSFINDGGFEKKFGLSYRCLEYMHWNIKLLEFGTTCNKLYQQSNDVIKVDLIGEHFIS